MSKKQYLKKLADLMIIVKRELVSNYYVVSEPRHYELRFYGTNIALIKSRSRVDFLYQVEKYINRILTLRKELD